MASNDKTNEDTQGQAPDPKARTRVSDETRRAERDSAGRQHVPDRMPTAEEEAAAPAEVDRAVSENYEEMMERGANQKGEGRI